MKKKILIVSPHFSTGGAPAFVLNKVELLKDEFEILVVEYSFLSWQFTVQRDKIIEIADYFKSLGDNKYELIDIIKDFNPDIISIEEFPEMFMEKDIADWVYQEGRSYKIYETTHDSSFNPANKIYMPDKFLFVSAYSGLKYTHLDIPQEVIEYPIDQKEQDKLEAKTKLNLDLEYKHVVIVGLFTERKNQKYAMELCEQTAHVNIKYHFLGNQADNFASYWQPLMDWKKSNPKLDNCIIHGEVSNVEDFINAADLFLFPSKGDRGNKELNPLVIKHALQYDTLPLLMYNLDVYLNKYNGKKNVHFLTGDVTADAEQVIELTNTTSKELIIIGTYPNLKSRVQLTKDTINSVKKLGRKILLVSHYPVDSETQAMVDFYIYDKHNPLCHHSFYKWFNRTTDDYEVQLNINGLKNANQSLAVYTNLCNAVKFARTNGFESFFYTTYDVVLDKRDIPEVERGFKYVGGSFNAYLSSLNTPFGKGIQTNGMFFKTDYFLNKIDASIRDPKLYNAWCHHTKCENFLEDFLFKQIYGEHNTSIENIAINHTNETLLVHSGLGVASNSEYYSILPIKGEPNNFMFYFYTYNIDDRVIWIKTFYEGNVTSINPIQIKINNEYQTSLKYIGTEIKVELSFYDDTDMYKQEVFIINEQTISNYQNTGSFKWKKKPKIKLVHLQTTIGDDREQQSINQLIEIDKYGIKYILHKNEPYKDLPPKHNCQRPQCVSMELFDEDTVRQLGTALTPAHYGCYDAFRTAILSEFDDDLDFLMIAEGDCKLEVPVDEFCATVFKAAEICDDNNIGYFSFGDTKTLQHGWLQSPVVQEIPNQDLLFITDHIIGIQCIMFSKATRKYLKECFRTLKWDAADMILNQIFYTAPTKMGILHKRITSQFDGYSLIDQEEKKFI
jgi:glycosyltransferase involved in cell wall biosynthesis